MANQYNAVHDLRFSLFGVFNRRECTAVKRAMISICFTENREENITKMISISKTFLGVLWYTRTNADRTRRDEPQKNEKRKGSTL